MRRFASLGVISGALGLVAACGDVLPPLAPDDGAAPIDDVAADEEDSGDDSSSADDAIVSDVRREAGPLDVVRDAPHDMSIEPSVDAPAGDGLHCGAPADCALVACDGVSCGANGRICKSSTCACPGGQTKETTCNDGADNDCDGLKDCADPDCLRAQCGASGNQRCCGATCVDTETDPNHCQGCGTACAAGQMCRRFSDAQGVRGMCTCANNNDQCVRYPSAVCRYGNADGVNNVCACHGEKYGNAGCAEGQTCVLVQDGPNFCRY